MKTRAKLTLAILTSLICSASAWAAESRGEPGRSSGKTNPLKNVYFGEQHLHTQDSPDAYSMGTRNPNSDLIKKHGDNEIIKMILSGDPKQGDKGPDATFSAFDSDRPENLWTYIQSQRDAGKQVFAIPHNANLSNGLMFAPRDSDGQPIDSRYAKLCASMEPATEILQTKGQSDTHPALSPNDEFGGFEKQYSHMIGTNPPVLSRINYSYVREALINGVGYQEYIGANPLLSHLI